MHASLPLHSRLLDANMGPFAADFTAREEHLGGLAQELTGGTLPPVTAELRSDCLRLKEPTLWA